jgi:hypothetical protein
MMEAGVQVYAKEHDLCKILFSMQLKLPIIFQNLVIRRRVWGLRALEISLDGLK